MWRHTPNILSLCAWLGTASWGKVMRAVVGFILLLVALNTWAADWYPAVLYMVKPEYPEELRRQGLEGEVRVKVAVNGDGSVSDPKIVYSTNPLFAGAALKVMAEWRFASRPLAGDYPQQLIVFVPMLFELESKQRTQQNDQSFDLATTTCLQLNKDVNKYVRSGLNRPLADLAVFRLTQKKLIDGLVTEKYSSEQLAVGLYDLSQGMVKVAQGCQRKITRLYVDQLPPSVKALLVSGGMAIKTEKTYGF